jgi:hypothetical protein
MIACKEPTLVEQWRNRLGGRRRRNCRRPFGALGYLPQGPVIEGLIEIEKLLLVVLHDEAAKHGQIMLRLAGFAAERIPWGIKWGGMENCRFSKNLLLQPVPGGPGLRLNTASTELLQLGLLLDRDIERHVRYSRCTKRQKLQLPKLWAGFHGADAEHITGDGPELAAYCRRTGKPARRLMGGIRRDYFGLSLYPLSWVSHHWDQAVAVFADLERYPKRQVFPLPRLPDDLVGFQDAAEFDFYNSRFGSAGNARHRRRREPMVAAS